MDLYDYIEADFDYDEDEDGTLDVSTTTFEKEDIATETAYEEVAEEAPEAEADDTAETLLYPAEEESPEINEEPEAEAAEEEAEAEEAVEAEVYAEEAVEVAEVQEEVAEAEEAVEVQEEIAEAEEVIEVQEEIVEAQEIEEIVPTEEIAEETAETSQEADEYTPPAEMEFEDILSVSDENKRSHTGGDWGGTVPPQAIPSYESEKQYTQKSDMYDGYDDYDDDYDYSDEDYPEKKKGNVLLKVVLVLFAVLSLTLGTATAAMDILIDIDSGKLISDTYRLFSAKNDMPMFDINKGDLLVAKNAHIDTDDVYVYASPDNTYSVGKVLAITENSEGDSVLSTESQEGEQLITRDRSMGILISTYSVIGTVLSILCNYGIFMAVAFALIAVALIVLLIIISKKKKSEGGYISEDSSYDDSDDDYYGDDSSDGYSEEDDDEEYYSEYDTDGIEEGLFSGI
jgi:chemotaxis protein histidine kinase CheA